ncbi:serine hydrolase domain-containing protein [Nonomuraea soli]|uniref:CubicO group peptidase (Beta-lactamase class C family) n=1 Tax=Nonomuraea soli TaxID=1032476 RepID=A0A7W0HSP9_9ACTN|nr:serine hydrolase domain-containing protein [Nonomuraea soli]MBA2893891.1 CubicO group peptidase (beta-lactamase class C family) [Nonomuraea soli]
MINVSRRSLLMAGAAAVPAVALGARPAAAAALPATGTLPSQLAPFDQAVQAYMSERGITCGQLAVARNGKLLLARGYGMYSFTRPYRWYARVQPTSLFRVASLSKSITAAAILRLAQDGKLSLTAPVTTLLGLSSAADPRLEKVTLWRLMQHTGGWDRAVTRDPVWNDHTIAASLGTGLPVGHADIIKYVTARPLDFDPGTKVAYSNYGYLLLGRIIEKVTGQSYESYVQSKLLEPLGITRMRLGATLREEMPRTEVVYKSALTAKTVLSGSGASVPYPYGGFNMPNHDANGGWIASAVDMVRWAGAFDSTSPVLNATSRTRAFAKPETGVNSYGSWFGCGWSVRPAGSGINTWHDGSMPGTFTLLVRQSAGVTWCALFNRREEEGSPDFDVLDPVLWEAYRKVTSWPTTDLYPTYF